MQKIIWKMLLIWLLIAPDHLWAQAEPRVTISGRVTDAASGEPLPSVNVFITNTTLGAATDLNGFYSIRYVPLGSHVLFASLIGYESQKTTLRLSEPADIQVELRLKPKLVELGQVEVVAAPPHEWKENLRQFEEIFWGRNYHASECKILNPEVLDFTFEKAPQQLTATASQPLQIENRSLGYRIQLFLEAFRYYPDNKQVRYSFTPKFEELVPADPSEQKRWKENRLKAYRGSFRHFLVALTSGSLTAEGFQLYNVSRPSKGTPEMAVDLKRLLSPGALSSEMKVHFKGYLKVDYTSKYVIDSPTSWITTNKDSVTINVAGYVYDSYAFVLLGYWFSQRVAEMLPRDYQP